MYADDDNPKPLTPAEARLQSDWLLGALDYPDSGPVADKYFREGFALIRRLDDTEKVRSVLNSYLARVRDRPSLRDPDIPCLTGEHLWNELTESSGFCKSCPNPLKKTTYSILPLSNNTNNESTLR